MPVVVRVVEPETGEAITVEFVKRKDGTVFLRERPETLSSDPEKWSPRKLETVANFAEAAAGSYGSRQVPGELPPAALTVRRDTTGQSFRSSKVSKRAERQEELRRLVSPKEYDEAMHLLGLEVGGAFTVKVRSPALPRRTVEEALEGIPQLRPHRTSTPRPTA